MTHISSFFIAGINYKKSDASVRGQFSVNSDQYLDIITSAHEHNIKEFFVLSTCNRTEIYGFAENVNQLCQLLCSQTEGDLESFYQGSYQKSGLQAIEHLFNVSAGLDSQILGDYEIVGQIRKATKFSKQHNCIGPYLERLINEVLQTTKQIRTNTEMSGGTVSVSFAAVQYARQWLKKITGKKILLLGTGKIGRNTCNNIVDYLPGIQVTLINRTMEKAHALAEKFSLKCDSIDNLQQHIDEADVIIVATNADEPVITKLQLKTGAHKLLIDLSVPCNVSANVKDLEGIELINVDELSRIKDETLQRRSQEIPKVKAIIAEHIHAFEVWHTMRKHVPILKEVKIQLQKIHCGLGYSSMAAPAFFMCEKTAEEKIQKALNGMAVKMRTHNNKGCFYIEAMNDFISTASN